MVSYLSTPHTPTSTFNEERYQNIGPAACSQVLSRMIWSGSCKFCSETGTHALAHLREKNGAQFLGAYGSGRVASATFRVPVDPPGNFHIVFDNTYSFAAKTVDVNVVATFDEGGAGP